MINPFAISSVGMGYGSTYISAAGFKDGGRSGYWRLFYYNLQEEELKKYEQKQLQEAGVSEHEQKQGQEAEKGAGKTAGKAATTIPKADTASRKSGEAVPGIEELKARRKPIYQPQPQQFDVAPWLSMLNSEFQAWNRDSKAIETALGNQKAENENEEDELIHLLLLAA